MELDLTTSEAKKKYGHVINRDVQNGIEKEVSQYIQKMFSFCVLEVEGKEERLSLESKLITTVSSCKECKPSERWLGHSSPKNKIVESGLWQVNELYKEPLSSLDFSRMAELIP